MKRSTYTTAERRLTGRHRFPLWVPVMGLGLSFITYAWFLSFPLEHRSLSSALFVDIPVVYWIGFAILAAASADLGLNGKGRFTKWIGAICFFAALHSLAYFYHTLSAPGGFDPYFTELAPEYFFDRGVNPIASRIYPWPGFFALAMSFVTVTGIPLKVFQFIFYFAVGVLLSSTIFAICDRSKTQPFAAVCTYGITGYYFLDYQFAPQTLALALLMTILLAECKLRSSKSGPLITLLFFAATITHGFLQLFYLVYLVVRYLWTREGWNKIITYGAVFLAFNLFLSDFSLARLVLTLRISIFEFLGLLHYRATIQRTFSEGSDFLVQQFSRTTILVTGAISLFSFARGWKRELTTFDKSLFVTAVVLAAAGSFLWLVGVRGIQIGVVVLAIGSALFAKKSTPSWRKFLVFALVVLSISIPMHANFDRYLYQPSSTENAVRFLVGHVSQIPPRESLNIFVPQAFAYSIWLHIRNLGFVTELGGLSSDRFDYSVTNMQTDRYLAVNNSSYPLKVSLLMTSGNIVYNNGFARIAASPWQEHP